MIDHKQFRELIVQPALRIISVNSPEAEELVIATLAYESFGLKYLAEVGGDGVGPYMAQPETYKATISYINRNMDLRNRIYKAFGYCLPPTIDAVRYNLRFATIACYCQYLMAYQKDPGEIFPPRLGNLLELFTIFKRYYHNYGDVDYNEFVKRYETFIGEQGNGEGNEKRDEAKRKGNGKKEGT